MSSASTTTDPGFCSEQGLTEEEHRQALLHARTEEKLRCGEEPIDQYRHRNEACMQHSAAWQGPPKQMLGPPTADDSKLLWLPEPRRASSWLKMYFVACNGLFIRFEDFYESYCGWFEPMLTEKELKTPATPLGSPMSEGKQQVEWERLPQRQRLEEEEDTTEQQASGENLQKTETEQRPTRPTAAPFPTRVEFLRVLENTFHGVRFYNPGGRVPSWSSDETQCNACSKYLVSDICYRREPLTFASTNRKRNLRRLQRYKDQGDIVYPESNPAKLNTFARKLAEDPLFMLPQGTGSPWREREMRRMKVRSWYKTVEESAFPGVSLKKKVFSVPQDKRRLRAGRRARDTGLNMTSEMLKPRMDADERLAAGKGKGKQKKDSLEPQTFDPTSSTMPTAELPDTNRPTAPRRNSASANSVDIPTSSSANSVAPGINDPGLQAVAANVANVREFAGAVRRHNSSVIAAHGAAIPEELVGEFEKLGIQADFPQWKKGKKQ